MWMKNEYGGLYQGNLQYTNTTRKIGPYILKDGDVIIWMNQ